MGRERAGGSTVNPNDMYETPYWLIDVLCRECKLSPLRPDTIIDIGAGDGRIGESVSQWLSSEPKRGRIKTVFIDPHLRLSSRAEVADWVVVAQERFQEMSLSGGCLDLVRSGRILYVGNPPYSESFEIVSRAVNEVRKYRAHGSGATFLLRHNWFSSKTRIPWLRNNPPNRLVTCSPRPHFENKWKDNPKGATDSQEYAWAFWFNGEAGRTYWPWTFRRMEGVKR